MRIELRKNVKGKGRMIRVTPTGGEEVIPQRAGWLFAGSERLLISPELSQARLSRRVMLCYDVHELVSVREHLSAHTLDHALLCGILSDLIQVLDACSKRSRHTIPVLCDSRCIFMDEALHLHFVCLPMEGVAPGRQTSPLTFLRYLSDGKEVRFQSADDDSLAARLMQFVENEDCVFSLNRLRDFVEREHLMAMEMPSVSGGISRHALRNLNTGTVRWMREGKSYGFGRARGSDVVLSERPSASRRHAVVRCDEEGVTVVDQRSTNGTYVKGVRIAPMEEVRIAWGETFSLAGVTFRVERGE